MKPCLQPTELLSRLLAAPPLVRGDYIAALIRTAAAPAGPRMELGDGPERTMPWDEPCYEIEGNLAIVSISGPLYKGVDAITCWFWGLCSYDAIARACRELAQNPAIENVVFNFNSPGGMCTGCPETAELIAALGEVKGTIAYTDTQCCSAAYWLASQCHLVLASPSATVGCIGTYLAFYSYVEWLKQEGIELHLFRAGDLKGIGVFGKELTTAESAFLDASVQRSNARFHTAVISGRGPIDASTMQGQWFDGDEAVDLGLVDRTVNSLDELLAELGAPESPAITPAAPAPTAHRSAAAAPIANRESKIENTAAAPAAPIHVTVNFPPMNFGAPQITTHVDARLEKDSIKVEQSQTTGGAKKLIKDASGQITGVEPQPV